MDHIVRTVTLSIPSLHGNLIAPRSTDKFILIMLILSTLLFVVNKEVTAEQVKLPNIILIMADDLGYETIGANGGTSYRTPQLDRLATEGVRFTECYVQPLCTPTRVQLMTGMYNVRNYINFGTLDPRAVTFANLLKSAGYQTCICGKWQLGREIDLPRRFGFDESCLWQHTRRPPRYANPGLEYNGVEKDFTNGEYGPDLVNDYAIEFISRSRKQPFFLYYPLMLTHDPYQPTPDSATWDPKAIGENINKDAKHFGDMVTYMDKLIGKLVAKLEEQKLRENTLILFLGDNGTGRGAKSQLGDKTITGGKGTTTAAGMHVPLIASWPGKIRKGFVCNDLIDSTDFLPTLLDAARVKPPAELKLDGRSFLPQLRGEAGRPREWIYSWYSPRQGAEKSIREFAFNTQYKLYRSGECYDLKNDPEEKKKLVLSEQPPAIAAAVAKLQASLEQFKNARPAELEEGEMKPKPTKKNQKKTA